MKKIIFLLLTCLYLTICLCSFGQQNINKQVLYDDWPITVKSNKSSTIKFDKNTNRFVPIGTKWDHQIITYYFQNQTSDISGTEEYQAIKEGFEIWGTQTNLFFLEVCSEIDADIVILWGTYSHGDAAPFDGVGGVLAHTLGGPPPNVFGNQAGDIHFDDSETWTLNIRNSNAQPIDLITVAAHEIGHSLGLNHTTVPGSLMLANYSGSHRYLGADDIAGIQNLYGYSNPESVPITSSSSSVICASESVFTVDNLPSVDSILWEHGPHLTISSGQNTNQCTISPLGDGSSWVRAKLFTDCGSLTLPKKPIWVGNILPLSLGLNDCQTGMPKYTFCNGQANCVKAVSTDGNAFIDDWDWDVTSGYITYNSSSTNNSEVTIYPTNSSSFNVKVRAHNDCGWTSWTDMGVSAITCGGYYLALSPNPSNGETTVAIKTGNPNDQTKTTSSNTVLDANTYWELEVFTNMQRLKTKQTKITTNEIKLNTQNWKEGVYTVRARYKGEVLTAKLVVK